MTDAATEARAKPANDTVVRIPLRQLGRCPICGSNVRRNGRKGKGGVVCHAGGHTLQIRADTQAEADKLWNDTAADWAKRNTREGQLDTSLGVIAAIARIEQVAQARDNGFSTHTYQLRDAVRVIKAALSTPTPAGELREVRRHEVIEECAKVADGLALSAKSAENDMTWSREQRSHFAACVVPLQEAAKMIRALAQPGSGKGV